MVSTVIGRGSFVLEIEGTTRLLAYVLQTDGVKFYDQKASVQQYQSLFNLLPQLTSGPNLTNIPGQGHLSLISLPAAPSDAFYSVTLSASATVIKLRVAQSGQFAFRSSTFFKDLDVTFTESKGGDLQVEGTVNLCLLGRSDLTIQLNPILTTDGLVFKPSASQSTSFDISPLGRLTINSLEVGRNDKLWDGLQALYGFNEPTGNDFFDSSGTPSAINLTSSNSVQRVQGGILIGSSSGSSHTTVLQSNSQSRTGLDRLVNDCKMSNAITISAWVKPIRTLTVKSNNKELPARIVSLSNDTDNRNFMLGQDVPTWKQDSTDVGNRYVARLRRKNKSDENGEPGLISKAGLLPTDSLTYIVFTRGATSSSQPGKIYVNATDQTELNFGDLDKSDKDKIDKKYTTDVSGDFSTWISSFSLVLGNEKTRNRPWDGEIHQVAIYSRALSPEEIFYSYFPAIKVDATLVLSNVPVPLDRTLPVVIDLDKDQLTVDQNGLEIAPFLSLNQFRFTVKQSTPDILGEAKATLWGNELDFSVSLTADELVFAQPNNSQKALTLKDNEPLPSLGKIPFKQLTMRADRKISHPTWQFQTDGQVTFETIPSPLKGPFPVQLFLDDGIWFSISPATPLKLVENLSFDRANLRFARTDSGWQVQSDLRGDRRGISIPLFGEPRSLTAELKLTGTIRTLVLAWNRSATVSTPIPLRDRFGKLDLAQFTLTSNQVPESLLWQISMAGQIPLGSPTNNAQASVLEFSTEDGKILANSTPTPQPTKLEGKSRLQSLNFPIFAGDLQLKDTTFSLNGRFTLFPDWSLLQVNGDSLIKIAADGQVQCESPVQVTLPDFVLRNPKLVLANGRLTLNGSWLGEDVSFFAIQRADQSIWEGATEFKVPFSLKLGPLYDPQSSIKLADQIQVCQIPDCRQIMTTSLVIELSSAGYLARINSAFTWQDETQSSHDIPLAELQVFAPPATRNAILEPIIQQVKAQANELFGARFKPVRGYFITVSNDQKPLIYLGDRTSRVNQLPPLTTQLPNVFTVDKTVTEGAFALTQTGATCTLTVTSAGRSQTDLKTNYLDFLQELEKAPLLAGAANLVKARIAERIPVAVDQLLFYYYGVESDRSYVDLQSGMQLRVDYQNYQFVHPSDLTANSGFVGSGTTYYQLNSYPYPAIAGGVAALLGFDAFLNLLQPLVKTDVAKVGAGGALDFLSTGYRMPYFRLIYPSQVSEVKGQIGAERFATLVGATTLAELENATNDFQGDGTITPTDNRVSVYFRGRATVIPEISVFVQGQPVFVPVGTTVRHVLERYSNAPAALPNQSLSLLTGSPYISRLIHDGVESTPSYQLVNLEAASTSSSGMDIYDLPLVKGDRIFL